MIPHKSHTYRLSLKLWRTSEGTKSRGTGNVHVWHLYKKTNTRPPYMTMGTPPYSFEDIIHRKSTSRAVPSRMQITLYETRSTPHGASRSVLAMSAWSVKTRRAPCRHCRDAGSMVIRLWPCKMSSTSPRPPGPFDAVIYMPYARKTALKAAVSMMQLTLRATRQTTHSAIALGEANVCLIGENPTCSVQACEDL